MKSQLDVCREYSCTICGDFYISDRGAERFVCCITISLTKIIPKCGHMNPSIINLRLGLMDTYLIACYMLTSVYR